MAITAVQESPAGLSLAAKHVIQVHLSLSPADQVGPTAE